MAFQPTDTNSDAGLYYQVIDASVLAVALMLVCYNAGNQITSTSEYINFWQSRKTELLFFLNGLLLLQLFKAVFQSITSFINKKTFSCMWKMWNLLVCVCIYKMCK